MNRHSLRLLRDGFFVFAFGRAGARTPPQRRLGVAG